VYYLYILQSKVTGRFYIGQTQDVPERVAYHNANYSKSLKNRGPWRLVYTEQYKTTHLLHQNSLSIFALAFVAATFRSAIGCSPSIPLTTAVRSTCTDSSSEVPVHFFSPVTLITC